VTLPCALSAMARRWSEHRTHLERSVRSVRSQASPEKRQPIRAKFSGRSSASLPATAHSASSTPCQAEKRSSAGIRKQQELRLCTPHTDTVLSLVSRQVGWQSATQHTDVSCASGHSRTKCHCLTSPPIPDSAWSCCRTEDAVPMLRQMLTPRSKEQTSCT
jgi:hypothetical protein